VGYVVFLLTIGGIYFWSLTGGTGVPGKNGKSAQKPVSSRHD
jgi:high-affinity iron transporter